MPLFDAALTSSSDDLLDLARRGESPLVIGREVEARHVADLLAARRSVLLVGDAGAGKSAVVHRLVGDIAGGRISGPSAGLRLYRTSTSRLIAETKYLGEWQTKLSSVVADLEREPRSVLYVTDLWNLTSVGRSESTDETMADLLKEFVESHRIALLGEATKAQIAAFLDRAPSFRNLFVQVPVPPVEPASVRPILETVAGHLAARSGAIVEAGALDRAVELTDRFLPYRHQPGKAIELFERALHVAADRDGAAPRQITPARIEEAFVAHTGLPLFIVSDRHRVSAAEIRRFFRERVLGQDHALDRIVETIALYKAGLNDPTRPIGTFLFVGPTGVGKTELAKALAEFLFGAESRMLRFDMSEYKDYHSFEKLIGDPRKSGSSGTLAEAMRANAFAVVLLDEFEKAHPNIADLFLQVFDDGRLTDAFGQTVDFRNSIIILTSNVGTDPRSQARAIQGFGETAPALDDGGEGRVRRALDEAFRPEFLNRIEHIVVFRQLTRDVVRRIALKELARIYDRRGISSRGITVEVDDRLLDRSLDRGFSPRYGARALKRELTRSVVVPLAVALMENPVEAGQVVRLEPRGEDDVAVRVLETEESRRAHEVEEEVAVEGRRLALPEVVAGAEALGARIESIGSAYGVDEARRRLDAMREAQQDPGFWSDQHAALSAFASYNRAAAELGRIEELRERAAALAARAAAALRAKDPGAREALARDFLRAELAVDRLEVELTAFTEADDAAALVTVRVQGAGPRDVEWLDRLADAYLAWAKSVRRPAEVLYEAASGEGATDSLVTIRVDGPYAYGYLKGEAGAHRLRDEAQGSAGPQPVSAVATVEVTRLGDAADSTASAIEYLAAEAIRGTGRRLGRLRSRVVAREGDRVLHLQNGRNLQENRELAAELLASAGDWEAPRSGEPVRTYHLTGRRKVRDPRTGLAVTGRGVDAYIDGQMDTFLRRNAAATKTRTNDNG